MNRIFKRSRVLYLLCILFCAGTVFLTGTLAIYSKAWAIHPGNQNIYTKGIITGIGEIYDRTGELLAYTEDGERKYASNAGYRKATLHAVGDLDGFIATGVQNSFRAELAGFDYVNGTFTVGGIGNNMELTIDAALSEVAMNALGSRKGAVGVMNYKTGEILTMVSLPTYDPSNPPTAKTLESDKYKGVYVNRLLSGSFAPGSIFKLVTASAAMTNIDDIFEKKYRCKSGVEIGGEWLSCTGNHREIGIEKALVVSCNAAFAQIGQDVGREGMLKFTKKLGFGGTFTIDGLKLKAGKYELNGATEIDFGWSCIGQHNDTVNPMQYLMFVSAIANSGKTETPYFVKSIKTGYNLPQHIKAMGDKRLLSSKVADKLAEMMRNNVKENYGEKNFAGLNLCAKSGTAEIEKSDKPHSWFVGFMDDEENPYAFVVVAENSGAGAGVAATIAKKVMSAAKELIY